MTLDEGRAHLNQAEASLQETAEQLIRFPLDPGCACTALERANLALGTVRKGHIAENGELVETIRRIRREAARVQGLLEAAAGLTFGCFSGGGMGAVSYTAAGDFQADPQPGGLAIQV